MIHPELLVYRMRQLASEMLPMEGSNIPVDICLAVAFHHRMGETLTMKGLVHELPYSEAGIQHNLRDLERSGWVEVRRCSEDRRVRRLHPSAKLEQALNRYWDTTVDMVDRARHDPESLVPREDPPAEPEPFIKPPVMYRHSG